MDTDINKINQDVDASVVGEEEQRTNLLENAKKSKVDKTREKEVVLTDDLE